MTTILIDPGLFEISPDMNDDDQQEHVELLANTIPRQCGVMRPLLNRSM